jgi:hypothetical protein
VRVCGWAPESNRWLERRTRCVILL